MRFLLPAPALAPAPVSVRLLCQHPTLLLPQSFLLRSLFLLQLLQLLCLLQLLRVFSFQAFALLAIEIKCASRFELLVINSERAP